MREWFVVAFEPGIVIRAVKYSLIVGALLIAINYGDIIIAGGVTGWHLVKMALTITVPYGVSTASSVGALLEQRRNKQRRNKES